MKFIALAALAILLTGCDTQLPSKVAAQSDEVASLNQRMSALEDRVSTLEKQPAGHWILWQVSEAFNAGYPQALSAYSSKPDCSTAAERWSYPGGKVVGQDPVIFQMRGYRIRLECLPTGTNPYAH